MGWVTLSQEILELHGQNDLIHILYIISWDFNSYMACTYNFSK